jgi:hypothetical protein
VKLTTLIAAALAFFVVACGGSDPQPASTSTPAPPPATQSSPAAASASPTPGAATPTPARPAATPTNQQILAFVKHYVRTEWNFLASSALPRDLYDMFLPECQRMVTLESLARTPPAAQTAYRGLKGVFIQDITFQDDVGVRYESGNTLRVVLPKLTKTSIVIDGKPRVLAEWLVGMSTIDVKDDGITFAMVPSGSTFKVSSCESLTQWSKS